jgi:membrane protease YdiL (CAAX protease family)
MPAQETAATGLARPTMGMALVRFLLFLVPIVVLLVAAEYLLETQLRGATARTLALQGLLCVVWIAFYRIGVRLLERRSASELSFDASLSLVGAGILIGTALFCSVYAVLWASGMASLVGWHGLDGVAAILGVSMTSAVGEEIVFRGVVYRILENTFGTLTALIVSSLLFGLMHSTNPGATLFTSTAVALEAGLLLGLAYSATRSLWFPIGVHFGWNFTQGGIFSAPVSGFQFKGFLNFRLSGPEIMTGGSFGPEASIVALLVCLFGSLWMVWAVIRFARWRPVKVASRAPRP